MESITTNPSNIAEPCPAWRPKLVAALAGCLAFQGEFLAGKQLLPEFGGAAYVWCSAILFFQIVLIAGYYGSRRLNEITSKKRNIILAALGFSGLLTLVPHPPRITWLPEELQPLAALLPFAGLTLALFCTTPLLHQTQKDRTDFSIYAWSNVGALLGLVSYPLLIEPLTDLRAQNWVWAGAGLLICLVGLRSTEVVVACPVPESRLGKTRWQWWVLPAISSATLLATTNRLNYEASSGPLTWAFPLALFLLSYIWAFSGNRQSSVGLIATAGLMALTGLQIVTEARSPYLLAFLLIGGGASMLACHVWLAASRDANTHGFYSASAMGGALGSALMVVVIPRITTGPIEFPILTLGTLTIAGFLWSNRIVRPFLVVMAVMAIGACLAREASRSSDEIARARTLYSSLRVTKDPDREYYTLINNITVHGAEDRSNPEGGLTYFNKESGIGKVIHEKQLENSSIKLGVIGLGAGTIIHLLRSDDDITYYELDPKVEELARKYFTYLRHVKSRVLTGDGRKTLEESPDQQYDILVLDAFTGDAIPTHLLTTEAGRIYRRHLKPNGVLAIHITNAHVDLQPVTKGLAQSMGMTYTLDLTSSATWVLLRPGATMPEGRMMEWTDQRSSILKVLKFKGKVK